MKRKYDWPQIEALYADGESWRAIAKRLGANVTSLVSGAARRARAGKWETPLRGKGNHSSSITAADWIGIEERYLANHRLADIARDFGVSQGSLQVAIVRRRKAGKWPVRPCKIKTPRRQLDYVRDWDRRHPDRRREITKRWEMSEKGRAWLAANQKKKNAARKAWRAQAR